MTELAKVKVGADFLRQKELHLSGLDLSRKGSIDERIVSLVRKLNSVPQYFTTSSCSGRIIIAGHKSDSRFKKKGCQWIYVTHDLAEFDRMNEELARAVDGDYFLKFEPFIMHVQCANLEAARELLQTSVASGYRNSGISVNKKGKLIAAVRTSSVLQVPLVDGGRRLVGDEYLRYLTDHANQKMAENFDRIRLLKSLLVFNPMELDQESGPVPEKTTPVHKSGDPERLDGPPKADYSLDVSESDDGFSCNLFSS